MSAILTVSLDGYLDQQRISFESPPGSDIAVPQQHHSASDESYPVFSPIPDAVSNYSLNYTKRCVRIILWWFFFFC